MSWVYLELALVSLAAMLSPTTLTFSVLALVLAKRPLRTGVWFYLGAFAVTIAIGILAAFVLGDVAAASVERRAEDLGLGLRSRRGRFPLWVYVARTWRVPISEKTTKGMVEKMSSVASSPWSRCSPRARHSRTPAASSRLR